MERDDEERREVVVEVGSGEAALQDGCEVNLAGVGGGGREDERGHIVFVFLEEFLFAALRIEKINI